MKTKVRRWKKPLTPGKQAAIKKAIAERQPPDSAYACINNDKELRLIFPVIPEFTDSLRD